MTERAEVIVVGGGPAGSSCAWKLREAGVDVIVLDRAQFPRLKLCAGWVTPQAMRELELDPSRYPHRLLTFDHITVHCKGLKLRLASVQHSIRRFEFDHFLLERARVRVDHHHVKSIERRPGGYLLDGRYQCRYLVGAGGTRCPVYRALFRGANPRARSLQVVTYEHEFEHQWHDGSCHLWFFDRGLPGYSWYVPKADGYLNVGTGGMAEKVKRRRDDIKEHWRHFTRRLDAEGFVSEVGYDPHGYSYYLRGGVEVVREDDAFIVGDAVGLATRDMCEGIGPAVSSGIMAAEAIASGSAYSVEEIGRYSAEARLVSKSLEFMFVGA